MSSRKCGKEEMRKENARVCSCRGERASPSKVEEEEKEKTLNEWTFLTQQHPRDM